VKAGGAAAWEVGEGEDTEAVRLQRAHALIRTQDTEMAEVRARNASLAARLIQLAKGGGGGEERSGAGDLEVAAAAAAEKSKARVVQLESQCAAAATQHAAALAAAAAEAAEARAAVRKHEESLQSLSEAYNGLETSVYTHEEAERTLKAQLLAVEERAVAAEQRVGSEASAEALAAAREAGHQAATVEAAEHAEAARNEGAAEAEAAGEAEMNDLLVCLGQEESKVEVLREKLEAMGVDVELLLATVGVEDDEEEEEGDA
jgi:hypothetical protein